MEYVLQIWTYPGPTGRSRQRRFLLLLLAEAFLSHIVLSFPYSFVVVEKRWGVYNRRICRPEGSENESCIGLEIHTTTSSILTTSPACTASSSSIMQRIFPKVKPCSIYQVCSFRRQPPPRSSGARDGLMGHPFRDCRYTLSADCLRNALVIIGRENRPCTLRKKGKPCRGSALATPALFSAP